MMKLDNKLILLTDLYKVSQVIKQLYCLIENILIVNKQSRNFIFDYLMYMFSFRKFNHFIDYKIGNMLFYFIFEIIY
jgi:hypothetical protein